MDMLWRTIIARASVLQASALTQGNINTIQWKISVQVSSRSPVLDMSTWWCQYYQAEQSEDHVVNALVEFESSNGLYLHVKNQILCKIFNHYFGLVITKHSDIYIKVPRRRKHLSFQLLTVRHMSTHAESRSKEEAVMGPHDVMLWHHRKDPYSACSKTASTLCPGTLGGKIPVLN